MHDVHVTLLTLLSYIVGRTEEKLEKVVQVHGKDIAGQIIPIVGDISTKDGVE